ncbi:MAG TPA: hypothetical protein VF610_02360, partial [Segetibacter sp.]
DEDVETTAPAEPEKVIVEEKKALFPDPTNTPVAQENLVTEVQPLKTRVLPRVSSIAPVGNSFARGEDSKKTIIQDLNEAPENDMRWENKNLENDIHSQVFNSALPSEGNTLVVNRAKVLEDLETVLLELNNVKLQKEMDKLYRENFDEVAKAGSKNKRDAEVEIFRSKQEEWKTIANQIRSQIEKAKTNVSKLSNSKTGQNVTFSFTVPDVNNKPAAEKASHYSFEYSVEPGIKLIAPKILPKVNQQTSRRKLTELSGEVQQQKTIEYLSIPAKPAPPVKRIHIIRI